MKLATRFLTRIPDRKVPTTMTLDRFSGPAISGILILGSSVIAGVMIDHDLGIHKTINGVDRETGRLNSDGWIAAYVPDNGPPDPDPNDAAGTWLWADPDKDGDGVYRGISTSTQGMIAWFVEIPETSPQQYNWYVKDANGNIIDHGWAM